VLGELRANHGVLRTAVALAIAVTVMVAGSVWIHVYAQFF
jgi:hypothetical protein